MVRQARHLLVLTGLFCILCNTPLFAAQAPVITLDIFPSVYASDGDWSELLVTEGMISFKSENSGNVRGEVALTYANTSDYDTVDDAIWKAYLKARFPSFRLTMGKTRLSWGEGTLFNAGDLLFGSDDMAFDLTDSELRTETDWLAAITVPFDSFSFAELVILPSTEGDDIQDLSYGGRVYHTLGKLKTEAGAARIDGTNKGYLGFQGNFGLDWHLTTSLDDEEEWEISGGLSSMRYLEGDKSLSMRFEFLLRPLGDWQDTSYADGSWPLMLYPELTYVASSSLAFSLRSIVCIPDLSTTAVFATSWNVFQGFSLVGYVSAFSGDWTTATSIDLSLSTGVSWIF
jgi:hypothetical protein